jgi:hypothetical protein
VSTEGQYFIAQCLEPDPVKRPNSRTLLGYDFVRSVGQLSQLPEFEAAHRDQKGDVPQHNAHGDAEANAARERARVRLKRTGNISKKASGNSEVSAAVEDEFEDAEEGSPVTTPPSPSANPVRMSREPSNGGQVLPRTVGYTIESPNGNSPRPPLFVETPESNLREPSLSPARFAPEGPVGGLLEDGGDRSGMLSPGRQASVPQPPATPSSVMRVGGGGGGAGAVATRVRPSFQTIRAALSRSVMASLPRGEERPDALRTPASGYSGYGSRTSSDAPFSGGSTPTPHATQLRWEYSAMSSASSQVCAAHVGGWVGGWVVKCAQANRWLGVYGHRSNGHRSSIHLTSHSLSHTHPPEHTARGRKSHLG